MTYTIRIFVDGGCRHNGQSSRTIAATAVLKSDKGAIIDWRGSCLLDPPRPTSQRRQPYDPRPTNQRAELTSLILALHMVIDIDNTLTNDPWLDVKIYSDSKYAVSCMNEYIHNWYGNGWRTARGRPVVNQDLIKEVDNLGAYIRKFGWLEYCWIPRSDNQDADRDNEIMDDHEQGLDDFKCDELGCLGP